jgi:hypothetical protein
LFKKLGVYFIQVTRKRLQDMFKWNSTFMHFLFSIQD